MVSEIQAGDAKIAQLFYSVLGGEVWKKAIFLFYIFPLWMNNVLFIGQGKVIIRPIAFRPTPGRPSSSTGPLPPSRPGSSAPSPGPLMPSGGGPPYSRPPSQGFAPGHPLVREGPRPFGSKCNYFITITYECFQELCK